jgi:hypothetical protein
MTEEFSKITLTKLDLAKGNAKETYLVYKNTDEYVEVEAGNAAEAIEKSALDNPYMVQFKYAMLKSILDKCELVPISKADDVVSKHEDTNAESNDSKNDAN